MEFTAVVTRTALGLGDLAVHDPENGYRISSEIAFNVITWRREQVQSPYVAGKITVGRVLDAVDTTVAVEVTAANHATLQARVATLIEAFTQDLFYMTFTLDGTEYKWKCEAADYGMNWEHTRLHAKSTLVAFQFPRHPNAIGGPV